MLTFSKLYTIILLVLSERAQHEEQNGVWLSLARAPGLGPGGRRFESCHPDARGCSSVVEHQPSKLDMWVRFPSPASILKLNIELVSVAQLDRATAF